MTVHSPWLLGAGLAVLLLGGLLWRWAQRNSIDIRGAAVSSAIATARSGLLPGVPDHLKGHVDKIAAAGSNTARAKMVGGTVARHFMAKAVRMAGLVGIIAGIAMSAAAVLWK